MGVLESVVAQLSGAVIAVDGDLRVRALSKSAQEALGVSASEAEGRHCYDIMSAVDSDSGRPCHEQCPLSRPNTRPGWAFNRIIDARWTGGQQTRLDCFLMKSRVSSTQTGQLCILGPFTASTIEANVRGLQAIEAINPAVSNTTDVLEVADVSLKAILRTTTSDVAELLVVDDETRQTLIMESRERGVTTKPGSGHSFIGADILGATANSELPLLAVGQWLQESSEKASGWYVAAPLMAESRVIGAIAVASRRSEFDVAGAVRILFSVVAQLSLHLWIALRSGNAASTSSPSVKTANDPSRLSFRCLGPFQVSVDAEVVPVDRFERLKAFTLLKYLVAHRRGPVSREALMEVLWPGADPTRSRGNLRVVLHALRRTLEPQLRGSDTSSFIVSQGNLVHLTSSESIWVDAEEFSQSARRAARFSNEGRNDEALDECRRAITLYRGDYLEDEPYDDWWLFERERLREFYLDLLKIMASILFEQGDALEAIERCQSALAVDPRREEVHRELMKFMWQSGRPVEALEQYEECRRLLQEEIGVEPTRETQSLRDTILADGFNGKMP